MEFRAKRGMLVRNGIGLRFVFLEVDSIVAPTSRQDVQQPDVPGSLR